MRVKVSKKYEDILEKEERECPECGGVKTAITRVVGRKFKGYNGEFGEHCCDTMRDFIANNWVIFDGCYNEQGNPTVNLSIFSHDYDGEGDWENYKIVCCPFCEKKITYGHQEDSCDKKVTLVIEG